MSFPHDAHHQQLSTVLSLAALAVLPFSYYPLVSFGSMYGVHIDGSLLYAIVLAATLASLPVILKRRQQLFQSKPMVLLGIFWLFCGMSLSWSDNLFRGAATTTFLLLLIGFVCAIATGLPALKKHEKLLYQLLVLTVGASIIWALWQIYGDALGVNAAYTLLPTMYQSAVFGIARPTAFALEPQFFASLVIIPLFWLAWQYLITKPRTKPPLPLVIALAATSSVLLLTLSRGGIYATILGFVVLFIFEHRNVRRWISLVAILLTGVAISTLVILSAASINQRDSISGYESLSKVVSHLTLGVVDLPMPAKPSHNTSTAIPPTKSGYVSSSTDSRTSMSGRAVSLWTQNPQTLTLGVGIGGFGAALHAQNAHFPKGSVVNNYYLELLVETGLVGMSLFVAFLGALLYQLASRRQTILTVLLVSLLVQLCFFSGNANIIHLWALIGVVVAVLHIQPKNKRHLVQ